MNFRYARRHIEPGLLLMIAWIASSDAHAQGLIHFATRVAGLVNAPVTYRGELVDSSYWGQLYAAPVGETLLPLGQPVEFRGDIGRGYITSGGTLVAPGTEFSPVQVKLVAWAKALGNNYESAQAQQIGGWGESTVFTVLPTTSLTAPPASLIGLSGFEIMPLVPEPSPRLLIAAGLILVGASASRRHQRRHSLEVDTNHFPGHFVAATVHETRSA